jgi:RNA polymerase sigma factor (sigma-70 family)
VTVSHGIPIVVLFELSFQGKILTMPPQAAISGFEGFLAEHSALLKLLHVRASAARWNVSCEEFATALYRSAAHHFSAAPGETAEKYFGALHLEDLALACALRNGSEPAWEQFVSEYRPTLRAAARAIVGQGREEGARELADSLYAELFGLDRKGGERKTSLLDYFHGRSKLSTWLRAVLAQRHVDGLRGSRRTQPIDDGPGDGQNDGRAGRNREDGQANAGIEETDLDRARLLPLLAGAVAQALAALPAADRLLLLLYYVQGLRLAQIARILGAHEATASRRLQKIRAELRQRVEGILAAGSAAQNAPHNASHSGSPAAKGLSPAEIRACLDYAWEDWSFDLAPALADGAAQGNTEEK